MCMKNRILCAGLFLKKDFNSIAVSFQGSEKNKAGQNSEDKTKTFCPLLRNHNAPGHVLARTLSSPLRACCLPAVLSASAEKAVCPYGAEDTPRLQADSMQL